MCLYFMYVFDKSRLHLNRSKDKRFPPLTTLTTVVLVNFRLIKKLLYNDASKTIGISENAICYVYIKHFCEEL